MPQPTTLRSLPFGCAGGALDNSIHAFSALQTSRPKRWGQNANQLDAALPLGIKLTASRNPRRWYLTLRHSRSMKALSRHASLPSMLIAMPFLISRPVNAAPMNCEPLVGVEDLRLAALVRHVRCLRCLSSIFPGRHRCKVERRNRGRNRYIVVQTASNQGA